MDRTQLNNADGVAGASGAQLLPLCVRNVWVGKASPAAEEDWGFSVVCPFKF